jgi:hypothetical protein
MCAHFALALVRARIWLRCSIFGSRGYGTKLRLLLIDVATRLFPPERFVCVCQNWQRLELLPVVSSAGAS